MCGYVCIAQRLDSLLGASQAYSSVMRAGLIDGQKGQVG